MLSKREILEIIDTTANFNAYIEGMDTLNGQSLDLVMQVAGVDGQEWTDEECLEIIKEIVDHTNNYRNTHDWDD
jgi:hypothetical protein